MKQLSEENGRLRSELASTTHRKTGTFDSEEEDREEDRELTEEEEKGLMQRITSW